MQNAANTSSGENSSAKTISTVIGVANMGMGALKMQEFAGSCAATPPGCQYMHLFQGILHFAMGAQSFNQANNHAGAAYQAGLTGVDTSAWNHPFGDPNNPTTPSSDPTKDENVAAVVNTGKFNEIKKALTTTGIGGVRLNPKTGIITDKNSGKSYDTSKLGSAQGMVDAGFSAKDIAAAMDASSKAEKAAMKKLGLTEGIGADTAANGYNDDGGSGGTMSGKAGDITTDGSGGHRGLASSGAGVKIPSNQIAGLSKNFNGERIGVSAENIFHMMARRYKTKEKQNSFFDPSELVKMPQ